MARCLVGWCFMLSVLRGLTVPSNLPMQFQQVGYFSKDIYIQALRSSESNKRDLSFTRMMNLRLSTPLCIALRGGARPEHLPRSFKRALRRHTKARIQEEGKGRIGSLSRKIAALDHARKAASKPTAAPNTDSIGGSTKQLAITTEDDEDDSDASHPSSELGGRGGWMHAFEQDPPDLTVLLQAYTLASNCCIFLHASPMNAASGRLRRT